jgi:hypothetical protein
MVNAIEREIVWGAHTAMFCANHMVCFVREKGVRSRQKAIFAIPSRAFAHVASDRRWQVCLTHTDCST